MLSELDQFYLNTEEPNKSCFLALRDFILAYNENITAEWKYKLPFFYFKGKMFCYLWKNKKSNMPYVCIVRSENLSHPSLVQEERKKMKAFYIDPNADIDVETLSELFDQVIPTYE